MFRKVRKQSDASMKSLPATKISSLHAPEKQAADAKAADAEGAVATAVFAVAAGEDLGVRRRSYRRGRRCRLSRRGRRRP